MTLQEYFATPERLAPQELIFGVMHVADAPFVSRQRLVLRLTLALERHVAARGLGEVLPAPVDVVLDAERALVLQPDLLFVSAERHVIVTDRVHGAPDLVVDVLSPRPRIGALEDRVRWFARYGVREIWLYHQLRRQLHVLECGDGRVERTVVLEGDDAVRSRVLPGLSLTVASIVNRYGA